MRLKTTSMFYGTLVLTVTSGLSQLLGFVYRIFLSRLVGAEVLGLYQLIMPVYSVLLSVTAVGLTVSNSNLSAEYLALGNQRAVGQTLRVCLCLFFVFFGVVALVVGPFSDPISVYLLGDARTRLGLVLLLPCLLLTGVENLHKHYFYGTGNVRPAAVVELAEQVVRTVAVLSLLAIFLPRSPERTVGLIVTGMVICEVFSSMTLLFLYRRHMGPPRLHAGRGVARGALLGRIGAIALPVGATALLGNLMGAANAVLIPRRLVAGGMEPTEAMSAFGVLFGMTIPLLFLPTAVIGALGLVLVPKLAESRALGRREEIGRRVGAALFSTSALMLPAIALLLVLGPAIAAGIYREPRAAQQLVPLAAGMLLTCYQSVLGSALNGIGRQGTAARNSILCGAVQLAFTAVTVGMPGVGLRGYVAGFVVSAAAGLLLNWRAVKKETGMSSDLFSWALAPGLAALLSGFCGRLLFLTLQARGLTPVAAGLTCAVFCAVLYLSALQAEGVQVTDLVPGRGRSR